MKRSLYQILGVQKNASQNALEEAFKKLQSEYNTLKEQGDQEASNELIGINHAYEVLSNPEKRAAYDEKWAAMQFQSRPIPPIKARAANTIESTSENSNTTGQTSNPNLVNCRACKQLISKNAKSCPHCGEENPVVAVPVKVPGCLPVLSTGFFIFLLAGVFGKSCTSETSSYRHDLSKASESTYNQDYSRVNTSYALSNAELAWHAKNTYGWDCSRVIWKGEMTSDGYFPIKCSNGTRLRVYLRQGQHPRITNSSGNYQ